MSYNGLLKFETEDGLGFACPPWPVPIRSGRAGLLQRKPPIPVLEPTDTVCLDIAGWTWAEEHLGIRLLLDSTGLPWHDELLDLVPAYVRLPAVDMTRDVVFHDFGPENPGQCRFRLDNLICVLSKGHDEPHSNGGMEWWFDPAGDVTMMLAAAAWEYTNWEDPKTS